jgi:hypothetical protein
MESSNNIIHPTRLKVLAFGSSCFGRVMMSVRDTTNKHHITDAVPICLRGYYKSIAAQSQTLNRLYNQKPDEIVERYLSTATATYQQTQLAIDTKCQ